jgi:hypothetical protein
MRGKNLSGFLSRPAGRYLWLVLLWLLPAGRSAAQLSGLSEAEQRRLFTRKTEERIRDLEANIRTISDKQLDRSLRDEAVSTTVAYFVDEERVFQVSSLGSPDVMAYPVRKYLNRLLVLPYSRVEIKWFETRWVSNFRQAPDGKYFGTVRVYQVFRGFGPEEELRYTDITSKDIEVAIEVLEMDLGGSTREVLHVRLGDVRVVETRAN